VCMSQPDDSDRHQPGGARRRRGSSERASPTQPVD
jgi:hypothetical protein